LIDLIYDFIHNRVIYMPIVVRAIIIKMSEMMIYLSKIDI